MVTINKEENITIVYKTDCPEEELIRLQRSLLAASRWYNNSEGNSAQDEINFQNLIFFQECLLGDKGL